MNKQSLAACICVLILFNACKKETSDINLLSADESSNAGINGPVRVPQIVWASTTKTQFIANADGNGMADFTLNFSSKKPGIQIVAFTFIAYETNEQDALVIFHNNIPGFFSPTSFYGDAKAITAINGSNITLPDDGSPVPVKFTIRYNIPSATGKVKSGDTVSIQLLNISFVNRTSPFILLQFLSSPISPRMMLTGSKPQLALTNNSPATLHPGLTRIFQFQYISRGGLSVINSLPLVINHTNARIRGKLIVKDENNQTINTTTVRNENNYTIHFPKDYTLNDTKAHTFNVYAQVYFLWGKADIRTKLQPSSAFSWTDVAGGQTMPFTSENAIYYKDYPKDLITVTKNY